MKILSVFGWSIRIGGHFKSALAHMKRLKEMGHDIYVVAPGDDSAKQMENEFKKSEIELFKFNKSPRWTRVPSLRGTGEIVRICREKGIDLIQAHDFISFPSCYMSALRLKRGIVFTKAGGPANNLFPPHMIDAIFYSQELLNGMVIKYHLNKDNITIIRARIDTDIYKPEAVSTRFMQKYNLLPSGYKIVLATRLEDNKKLWVDNLLSFAEQVLETAIPARIVIAGEGSLLDYIERRAFLINQKSNNGPIVHLTGPVFKMTELNQLYNYADFVVGNGRGILEAMACGKPVIIFGENGEAEVVGPDNIEPIATFNFSGRHFRHAPRVDTAIPALLKRLIADNAWQNDARRFSFEYIKNNMHAELGAQQLVTVYEKALAKEHSFYQYIVWYLTVCKTIAFDSFKRRFITGVAGDN
jgi:L-malate glycosyltransferase